MTRISIAGVLPFAAVLALAPLRVADYQPIGSDAEPLRSAFNAGEGKVRILMLVAPT
jgi:hypothetical protein